MNSDETVVDRVAVEADLEEWTGRSWAGGVELTECSPLDRFAVRTRNSVYEVTILEPHSGEVMVRGGQLFPEHKRALLAGCSLGGAFLKVRAIYEGFLMELYHDGERIVTTRVSSIVPLTPSHA